jgi:23S rRNA pseudouridine1911/1915/1917 synthase
MSPATSRTRLVEFRIGPDPAPRLDKALGRDVPEEESLSRSRLARLIEAGAVTVNGAVVTDVRARLARGQRGHHRGGGGGGRHGPEAIPLDIVHEDADLIVVNKPAGMVVHPAPGSPSGTLVNALLHHFGGNLSGIGGEKRPGIVHRIDKDTSGLLVVAKSDRAHHGLAAQFADHSITREYRRCATACRTAADPRLRGVRGVHVARGGLVRVSTQLARHKTDRQRQAVLFEGGRHAVTHLRSRKLRRSRGARVLPVGDGADASDPGSHVPYRPRAGGRSGLWRAAARVGKGAGPGRGGGERLPAPGAPCRDAGLRASR